MARLVSAVVSTSLLVAIESVSAQGLVPDCTLPFVSIAKRHPIDDTPILAGLAWPGGGRRPGRPIIGMSCG